MGNQQKEDPNNGSVEVNLEEWPLNMYCRHPRQWTPNGINPKNGPFGRPLFLFGILKATGIQLHLLVSRDF